MPALTLVGVRVGVNLVGVKKESQQCSRRVPVCCQNIARIPIAGARLDLGQ
jgi:hypothetical protein